MHRLVTWAILFAGAAAAPASPRTVSAGIVTGELRPGSSCEGIGEPVPLVLGEDVDLDGATFVQPFLRGCGCPTGPVLTLLFEPGTSPLVVRECAGPGEDLCEMGCRGELRWDLGDAMRAAGATRVVIGR